MGFFDALLGKRKIKGPAPDRLFAISTAYVGLDAQQGIKTRGVAGIVFQPLATGDFRQIVDDMTEVLSGTGSEMGSSVETRDDEFGYRWMIV
ncbi:MAG: PspA-associated protein PspAB, partial [Solirubrobacteraceae bacterium]